MDRLWTKDSFPKCDYFHSLLFGHSDRGGKHKTRDFDSLQNFVINMIMPMPVIGSTQMSSKIQCRSERTQLFQEPVGQVKVVLAGSSSEGLFLPRMTHIRDKKFTTDFPDEDIKLVFSKLVVCSKRNGAFACLEPSPHSPPAFVNLRFNHMFGTRKQAEIEQQKIPTDGIYDIGNWNPSFFIDDNGLVNRIKFMNYLRFVFRKHMLTYDYATEHFVCMKGSPDIAFSIHGPALTVEALDKSTKSFYSQDYVISLPCPTWPEQASDWPKRDRVWPPKHIVRKVVKEGCHVVPKSFKQTKERNHEFTFSFSLCDKTIANNLTLHQKRSYLLFKFLFKYSINRVDRGLHSYLCKTTFLWLCERKPVEEWTEYNPVECLVLLLKDFKSYLQEQDLPHFYIQDYNLISEISKPNLDACVKDVERILESPVEIMLGLTENHRFHWLSRDVNIRERFRCLFSKRLITRMTLRNSALSFLSEMLDRGEIQLVIPVLCKQWAGDYFTADLEHVIDVVEKLAGKYEHHTDIVNFLGLLANLYHQQGMENIIKCGLDPGFLVRSVQLYEGILPNIGSHIWIYGAYYDLLYQFMEYEKIVRHFLANLHSKRCLEESGIYTAVTKYNNLTTHPVDLTEMINFMVYLPAPGYILFKVSLAYMALSRTSKSKRNADLLRKEAIKVLVYFDKWVRRKCEMYSSVEDDILYYILSIAANEVGVTKIRDSSVNKLTALGTTKIDNVMFKDTIKKKPVETQNRPYLKRKVVNPVRKMVTLRFHPYNGKKERAEFGDKLPEAMRFSLRRVRIGQFFHQTVV